MKKTITRHEWEGNYFRKVCPICGVIKEKMNMSAGYRYIIDGSKVQMTEPKCITRKIQADEK